MGNRVVARIWHCDESFDLNDLDGGVSSEGNVLGLGNSGGDRALLFLFLILL